MIKTIHGSELKTNIDLVCCYCGKEHNKRDMGGNLIAIEGKDYVFERNGAEEYCIVLNVRRNAIKKV